MTLVLHFELMTLNSIYKQTISHQIEPYVGCENLILLINIHNLLEGQT